MSQHSQVALDDVRAMLEYCTGGQAVWKEKKHRWWVSWNHKTHRAIPLGVHGRRTNVTIEAGHVRSMVRNLGIDPACAARFIPMSF